MYVFIVFLSDIIVESSFKGDISGEFIATSRHPGNGCLARYPHHYFRDMQVGLKYVVNIQILPDKKPPTVSSTWFTGSHGTEEEGDFSDFGKSSFVRCHSKENIGSVPFKCAQMYMSIYII